MEFFTFNFNPTSLPKNVFQTSLDTSGNWIKYGTDNLLPNKFIELNNLSPTHGGIINRKADYTAGASIDYTNNSPEFKLWAELCNWEDGLHSLVKNCALDLHTYGGYCIQVLWNLDGTIHNIYYQDFSQIRRGFHKDINRKKATPNVYDQGIYISADWKNKRQFTPEFYEFFKVLSPENEVPREPVYLYYYRKAQGYRWYPVPDWYSGLKTIQSEIDLINYVYNNINQSFNPSGILKVPATLTPTDQEAFKNRIKGELSGTDNSGKILTVFADGDKAVEWLPLDNSPDKRPITETNDVVVQKIISAHKLPSPTIIGLPGGASISGDGNTIAIATKEFYNQTILPARQEILNNINKLIKLAGFNETITIKENIPYLDGQTDN